MKRSPITLENVASWETLMTAFGRAAQGKRGRGDVEAFRADLDRHIECLHVQLMTGVYQPDPMRAFSIRDPKPRMIHAPSFRDRVVHHALMAYMGPILDRSLIFHSYACRVGKGSHRAISQAARMAQRAKWFIHADIAQYFPSINHHVLKVQLAGKFKDAAVLDLVDRILEGHAIAKGLPIGALTSQNFANFHLGLVDRIASQHHATVGYLRYMDDMVWWGQTQEACNEVLAAVIEALTQLKLDLKELPQPRRTANGMTFCGYRILPGRVLLSKRGKAQFRRHLRSAVQEFDAGKLTALDLQNRVDPVLAFARHGRSHLWRNRQVSVASGHIDV